MKRGIILLIGFAVAIGLGLLASNYASTNGYSNGIETAVGIGTTTIVALAAFFATKNIK